MKMNRFWCQFAIASSMFCVGIPSVGWAQSPENVLKGIFDLIEKSERASSRKGRQAPLSEKSTNDDVEKKDEAGNYSVGGLQLGHKAILDQSFNCKRSDQFADHDWCSVKERTTSPRGKFDLITSVLRSKNGSISYVSRHLDPAYFDKDEAEADIETLTKRFGQKPDVRKLTSGPGLPTGIIASWGAVALHQLDSEGVAAFAAAQSPRKGLLVDYLNDFTASARQGLPIYRLYGSSGFVWAAYYDTNGIGKLRFFAVDSAMLRQAEPLERERESDQIEPSEAPPSSDPNVATNYAGTLDAQAAIKKEHQRLLERNMHECLTSPYFKKAGRAFCENRANKLADSWLKGSGPQIIQAQFEARERKQRDEAMEQTKTADLKLAYQNYKDQLIQTGMPTEVLDESLNAASCQNPATSSSDYECRIQALKQAEAGYKRKQRELIDEQAQNLEVQENERKELERRRQVREEEERKKLAEKEKEEKERVKKLEEYQSDVRESATKGPEFASESGTTWKIFRKKNEMTDAMEVTVESSQSNGSGALAQITGACHEQGLVQFTALITDDDRQPTVQLPDVLSDPQSVRALVRINGKPPFKTLLLNDGFKNRFLVGRLMTDSASSPAAEGKSEPNNFGRFTEMIAKVSETLISIYSLPPLLSQATWRMMFEINSDKGTILFKIPIFESSIRELIATCGDVKKS